MVTSAPSLTASRTSADGILYLRLDRFARKAVHEIINAVDAQESVAGYELDLRGNQGGDFDRMRRVAALFTGARQDAIQLHDAVSKTVDIPAPLASIPRRPLRVLIGKDTASSAEVLAALLRRYAEAVLAGERSAGKNYLYRIVPVHHDWRLMLPAERIEVIGETLVGGLIPDIGIPR